MPLLADIIKHGCIFKMLSNLENLYKITENLKFYLGVIRVQHIVISMKNSLV